MKAVLLKPGVGQQSVALSQQQSKTYHKINPPRRKNPKQRSSFEIIASILIAASCNGGEPITVLKQRANLSSASARKYIRLLLERKLISLVEPKGCNESLQRLYQPTELGYDFILRQRELLALFLDGGEDIADDQTFFHFWD